MSFVLWRASARREERRTATATATAINGAATATAINDAAAAAGRQRLRPWLDGRPAFPAAVGHARPATPEAQRTERSAYEASDVPFKVPSKAHTLL
jgi:hypothetical protein